MTDAVKTSNRNKGVLEYEYETVKVLGFGEHVIPTMLIDCRLILEEQADAYGSTLMYCTISTVSPVTRNGQKKSPCFKSLELERKFIGHLGQHIFRIRKLTVEMV